MWMLYAEQHWTKAIDLKSAVECLYEKLGALGFDADHEAIYGMKKYYTVEQCEKLRDKYKRKVCRQFLKGKTCSRCLVKCISDIELQQFLNTISKYIKDCSNSDTSSYSSDEEECKEAMEQNGEDSKTTEEEESKKSKVQYGGAMYYLTILLVFSPLPFVHGEDFPSSCDSPVYCYGDLLHTVQMGRIFNDSKTFVDLKMKQSQNQTLQDFENLKAETNNKPTKAQIEQFVWDHFEKGNELENHNLTDFNPNPAFINKISNETVKEFTQNLLNIWPQLARKVKDEVHSNVDRYSLIPIPNAFIVPGGRFLEYYYWDSYWIIEGLLVSEMNKTARGMIDNFLSLVNEYGFIPNGGRIYYLRRSQPPLLTAMAFLYYQHTNDLMWIKNNIQILAKELNYWRGQLLHLTKNGKTYSMYHYHAVSSGPRPESYREDYETSSYFSNETKRTEVYIDLKSAAESGWDFSSRWIFDDNGDIAGNLSYIQTKRVIPVDLNAFLCGAFRSISKLYKILHYPVEYLKWKSRFHLLRKAIREVLWNDQDGVWYDYDIGLSRPRKKFYPSNLTPLWSMCFDEAESHQLGVSAVKYLRKNDISDYMGGVPTSRDETGQQWDFPNAWAPLVDIVVTGLETTGSPTALEEANVLAKRWINSNIIGYRQTGAMFEKYNAIVPGKYGSGGEYEVQSGFGWSNGVALKFIHKYYT
ncbi:hypothetical protein FQA39_LY18856 [Lamprigera yunnana]|nr:hypothetical protein FQA39_LY18856 [Lamprigera yunnana]